MISLIDIIKYISNNGSSKPGMIATGLQTHRVAIQKLLLEWIQLWYISKAWKTPHVVYDITPLVYDHHIISKPAPRIQRSYPSFILNYNEQHIIDDFYKFDSDGSLFVKKKWFIAWCTKRNINPKDAAQRYISVINNIQSMKNNCWVINVTQQFTIWLQQKHKQKMYLDTMFYCDRYNYDEFGRWPLAEMTFYAKQSQNLKLIHKCLDMIINQIECIVHHHRIDAIAITPPSINRHYQLLSILQKKISYLNIPFVDMYKYYPNKIAIAQKTLKWAQRFINALHSIQIQTTTHYENILLIDDFVWSGATMNISAMKLKDKWIAKNIIWLSMVGNIDMSFDIINEI